MAKKSRAQPRSAVARLLGCACGVIPVLVVLALAVSIAAYVKCLAATATSPFPTEPLPKQYVTIRGKRMAYHERGAGDPVLFLHGNPTSSYLWRNVIPGVCQGDVRCVAPDLIGMGDSEKLPFAKGEDLDARYHFKRHAEFVAAFVDEVFKEEIAAGKKITIVIHDWGSGLGFHWAHTHQDLVRGIAFMEAIVVPYDANTMGPISRGIFWLLKTAGVGERLILDYNYFIEFILPFTILRPLSMDEKAEYRRPFLARGEDRRPTLTWPRMMPVSGDPPEVVEIVGEYNKWLSQSTTVPKLWINAEPGALIRLPATREMVRSWPNLQEATVAGSHFIQEDSPYEIAEAVRNWLESTILQR